MIDRTIAEADAYIEARDWDGAAACIEKSIQMYPDNEWLNQRLCFIVSSRDGDAAATSSWQRLTKQFPNFPEGWIRLSQNLAALGTLDEAEAMARTAVELAPDDVWALSAVASILGQRGKWEEALKEWRAIREAFPDHLPAYENEIIAMANAGEGAAMEARAYEFAVRWPEATLFPRYWADAPLRRQNRYATAQRWELIARARPNWVEAAYRAAEFYTSAACVRKARELLVECIRPEYQDTAFHQRCLDLAIKDGDVAFALSVLEAAPASVTSDLAARLVTTCAKQEDLSSAFKLIPHDYLVTLTQENLYIASLASRFAVNWQAMAAKALSEVAPSISMFDAPSEKRSDNHIHASCHRGTQIFSITSALNEDIEERALLADISILLRHMNSFVYDRRIRKYQWELFTDGQIDLSQTGLKDWSISGSVRLLHSSIALRLDRAGHPIWLISSGHGSGQELCMAYLQKSEILMHTDVADLSEVETIVRILSHVEKDISEEDSSEDLGRDSMAIVLIGHNNYAHFLWNEMAALCDAHKRTPSDNTRAALLYEPFGKFDLFVAPLIDEPPPLDKFSRHISFHLSGIIVTDEARALALRMCDTASGAPPPREKNVAAIWISLRLMYRHPINQLEFIQALVDELARRGKPTTLMLDGFSLPWDIDVSTRYNQPYLRGQSLRVEELAGTIMESPSRQGVSLIDFTGLDLPDAVVASSSANFYICSQGTQQHKIAWLHDVPGIIHTNRSLATSSPSGEWVQTQASTLNEAQILEADFVSDVETINERQNEAAFLDYQFIDPAISAKRSLDLLDNLISVKITAERFHDIFIQPNLNS